MKQLYLMNLTLWHTADFHGHIASSIEDEIGDVYNNLIQLLWF